MSGDAMSMPMKPRDPKRVQRILNKIDQVWSKFPDMRFNQLLSSITSKLEKRGNESQNDFFYTEDDRFEKALDDFMLEQKINDLIQI